MSTPSLLNVPYRLKAGTLYSQIPETGLGDFAVTRSASNVATRINSLGFIETVADNVPRLDYPLGGAVNGCPALLVEPSAQNQIQQSEDFTAAFHTKFNLNAFGSGSVANTTATRDPYGTNLADYIQENSVAGVVHGIIDIFAGNVSGTTYTWSVFAKAAERTIINLFENSGSGGSATFNLTTGVATLNTGVSASMQNYGNGWWRCGLTYASITTGNHNVQIRLCDASGNASYNGTGNQGAYIFGAQLETGSIATSYIRTTTAAITRGEDRITKTGITSLIGQTEGAFYFEGEANFASSDLPMINRSVTNSVLLVKNASNQLVVYVYYGGVFLPVFTTPSAITGPFKVAVGYKQGSPGDTAVFVNGVQVGTTNTTSWAFTGALTEVIVRAEGYLIGGKPYKVRALGVYPNRLSNSELATLTAP
jgi:hypothetical protein